MKNAPIILTHSPAVSTLSGPEEQAEFSALCKALAHPARIAILAQLIQEGTCVCGRIVEVMPLAQSTVSQHLKALKQAGLVLGEVEGPRTCYCIAPSVLARFRDLVLRLVPADHTGTGDSNTTATMDNAPKEHEA